MRKLLLLAPLLALAPLLVLGCTNERDAPDEASAAPIGPAVSCINLDQVSGRRPVPPRSIVFEVAGGVTYRNDVKDGCPSLERADAASTLAFEVHGSRLCENDNVRTHYTRMYIVGRQIHCPRKKGIEDCGSTTCNAAYFAA